MTSLMLLFAATLAVTLALSWVSVAAPGPLAGKLAVLALAALFLPLAHLSLAELLGRPKPARLEWLRGGNESATVLGSSAIEGERIYLWLRAEGTPEPRAYELPWDRRLAEQLQEAGRSAAERRQPLRMRTPFQPGLDDGRPLFYAEPQPGLPAKEEPAAAQLLYVPG